MVRYIQSVFESAIKFLGKWSIPVGIILLITICAGAILALWLYRMNKEALPPVGKELKRVLKGVLVWILLIGILLLQINVLKAIRQGVISRNQQASVAKYTSEGEGGGGEISQYGPTIMYNHTTVRTQRLIIPKYTLTYLNAHGLETTDSINSMPGWSPEELRYDSRPIINIEDQLEKAQDAIVINRKTTTDQYLPLKLLASDIKLKLTFKEQGNRARRQYYDSDFVGQYSFSNPYEVPKKIYFGFPYPYGTGTLSNFRMKVDGKDVLTEEVGNSRVWEQEVSPGKSMTVEVGYSYDGSRSWTYNLSSKREAINNFKLQVSSNNPRIKFQRGSMMPSKKSKGLMDSTLTWEASNLVRSQDISLYFPGISIGEVITRLYIFSPIALIVFVITILGWGALKGREVTPVQLILTTFSYSLSFALAGYLLTYMPLALAIIISFALSAFLNLKITDRSVLPPILVASLVPLTFIWVGNTGLLLCLMGMVVIGLFAFGAKGRLQPGPGSTKLIESA